MTAHPEERPGPDPGLSKTRLEGSGRIAGIARHDRPLGPMEVLERAELVEGQGVAGDFRGTRKAGSTGQNGVVLVEADDWAAAVDECGAAVPWYERRANLLVEGLDIPQR